MFETIKASLFRYCDMSLYALTQLKNWMHLSKSFSNFDPESFAATSIRVATATNKYGDPIVFCPVESILFVSGFAVSPAATLEEANRAGAAIEAQIIQQAQNQGISRVLIAVNEDSPAIPEAKELRLRVFELKVPSVPDWYRNQPSATQYLIN